MPECKYKLTEVELAIGSERFHWTGATPTSPGFTAVYPWQEVHGMETNVVWNKDQHWNVDQVKKSPINKDNYFKLFPTDEIE